MSSVVLAAAAVAVVAAAVVVVAFSVVVVVEILKNFSGSDLVMSMEACFCKSNQNRLDRLADKANRKSNQNQNKEQR